MPAAITTDQLLSRIKARAQIPATDGRLTDAELLAIVDDLILSSLAREIYDADDGRWTKTAADVSITAGTATYRIPTRAMSGGLDEVLVVDSAGNLSQLRYIDRSDAWEFGTSTGTPCYFTIVGDVVQLLPSPSSSTLSLRLRYLRRPSKLVTVAECASIDGVAATVLTVSGAPSSWASAQFAIDIVEAVHHGDALEDSVHVTANAGPTTLTRSTGTFATSGAYAIQASSITYTGQYACPDGESCIVQVPDVAIPFTVDLAARDVCVALGDMEGSDRHAQLAERRRQELMSLISERSRIRPHIVQRNSPLRLAGRGTARRWGR